jgi:hypothetical protein
VHGADIRTNNSVEGWHNRFKNVVATHRPNIWRLLLALRQEQAATEVALQQIAAGQRVHKTVATYKNIRKQLRRLLRRFRNGQLTVLQYIDGVHLVVPAFQSIVCAICAIKCALVAVPLFRWKQWRRCGDT